jgi:SAM-dependent methyltransferase
MAQDDVFLQSEGDQWYRRNKLAIENPEKIDWASRVIELLESAKDARSVLDLGCSDGWRLAKVKKHFAEKGNKSAKYVGVDASQEAVAGGMKRYEGLQLLKGSLSDIPVRETFDLVIVNSVFHWVDRANLAKSVAEVDRVTADGGHLIIGDFSPDAPSRRIYHHYTEKQLFTFKQDYPKIFESLGTYKEAARLTYDCDYAGYKAQVSDTSVRAYVVALKKSLGHFYVEQK